MKKKSVIRGFKKVGKKVTNGVKNVGTVVVAVVVGVTATELGCIGAQCVVSDAELTSKAIKHKVNPTPVLAKNGVFGKKQVVTVSPFSGKVAPYRGDKKPSNSKPLNLKKMK